MNHQPDCKRNQIDPKKTVRAFNPLASLNVTFSFKGFTSTHLLKKGQVGLWETGTTSLVPERIMSNSSQLSWIHWGALLSIWLTYSR